MLSSFSYPTFEEFLDIAYINLAIPGPQYLNSETLEKLADVECGLMLAKKQNSYPDNLGSSILRNYLSKVLFKEFASDNIICNSNIINLLNILTCNKIDYEIIDFPESSFFNNENNVESFSTRIKKLKEINKFAVLIFDHFTDLQILNNYDNLILISDVATLYGQRDNNLSFALIPDDKIFKKIKSYLYSFTNSTSYLSEVHSLICIKNNVLIRNIISESRSKNIDYLDSFFFRNKKIFLWQKPNDNSFIGKLQLTGSYKSIKVGEYKNLLRKKSILVNQLDNNTLSICTGQKDIGTVILSWQKLIDSTN